MTMFNSLLQDDRESYVLVWQRETHEQLLENEERKDDVILVMPLPNDYGQCLILVVPSADILSMHGSIGGHV